MSEGTRGTVTPGQGAGADEQRSAHIGSVAADTHPDRETLWQRLGLNRDSDADGPPAAGGRATTDTVSMAPVQAAEPRRSSEQDADPGRDDHGDEQLVAGPAARRRPGEARRIRKARLRLARLDPWSVMKTAFLFSIAAGIVLVVAVYVVWTVIGASGLFAAVNDIVKSVVSTPGDTTPFTIQDYVNTQKVMGVAALLAVVDVIIFTALATLASFLYNLAATMLGGLEITLAED